MRAAFREDVGLTALNLVVECELCHNDIRLPNIAFREGRFCLLDFDMAREFCGGCWREARGGAPLPPGDPHPRGPWQVEEQGFYHCPPQAHIPRFCVSTF